MASIWAGAYCQHALADASTKYTAKYKCQNYQQTHADVCTKQACPSTQGSARACTYHLATLHNCKYLTVQDLTRAFSPKNVEKTTKMNCTRRAISDSQTHQHLHSSNSMNMAHFRLCHVNTDLLGRAIFRRVLSNFCACL